MFFKQSNCLHQQNTKYLNINKIINKSGQARLKQRIVFSDSKLTPYVCGQFKQQFSIIASFALKMLATSKFLDSSPYTLLSSSSN